MTVIGCAPVVSRPNSGRPISATAWLLGAVVIGAVSAVNPFGFAPFGPLRLLVIPVLVLAALVPLTGRVFALHRATTFAWLVLLGWLFVASMFAVDPLHAWIGTPDRRLGFLAWVLFALGCGQMLTRDRDAHVVTRAAANAALAAGAYAVVELAGAAPVDIEFAASRVGGPFGQPAYLGAATIAAANGSPLSETPVRTTSSSPRHNPAPTSSPTLDNLRRNADRVGRFRIALVALPSRLPE